MILEPIYSTLHDSDLTEHVGLFVAELPMKVAVIEQELACENRDRGCAQQLGSQPHEGSQQLTSQQPQPRSRWSRPQSRFRMPGRRHPVSQQPLSQQPLS